MKIFGRLEQAVIKHAEHGEFEADAEGGFEVPHELGLEMLRVHIDGKPAFETDGERSIRLVNEDDEHRRDPKALYDVVEKMANALAAAGITDPEFSDAKALADAEKAKQAEADAKAAEDARAADLAKAQADEEAAKQAEADAAAAASTPAPSSEGTATPAPVAENATSQASGDAAPAAAATVTEGDDHDVI